MFIIAQIDNDQANDKDFANLSHVMSWMISMSIEEVVFLEIETSSRHQHDRFLSFSNEDGASGASLLLPRERGGRVHLLWHFGRNTLCKHRVPGRCWNSA